MPGTAGRNAVDLPWLRPTTDSLVSLAESPADLSRAAVADPALLAFLVRFDPDAGTSFELHADRFLSPRLPDTAAAYLELPTGWFDPDTPAGSTLVTWARTAGEVAARLAAQTGRVHPDAARAAAALAPLGWYAVAAVDPAAADACLGDSHLLTDPAGTQTRHWGLTHDQIARRLAGRWRLPPWVTTVIGHLSLPPSAARGLTADPDLFAVVQRAAREADAAVRPLGVTARAAQSLHPGLTPAVPPGLNRGGVEGFSPGCKPWAGGASSRDPRAVPLLRNLLRMAAEARRRNGAAVVTRLEDRLDELHSAIADAARLADDRVRDARLAGLAELAAGAGHEINNPLAVITGQAQRLLAMAADAEREPDPDRDAAARAIHRHALRAHGIIRDLMQFARPPRPDPRRFAAGELLAAARDDLADLAAERHVRLELVEPAPDLWADGDAGQLRRAVAAVVRNGVEAAPAGGWVRMTCEADADRVVVVVEDGGPGIDSAHRDSLFDPFFCGRSAGRRLGLGLPTAWRFARLNGGDVRFDPTPDGPTRFVVTVPRAAAETQFPERKSA